MMVVAPFVFLSPKAVLPVTVSFYGTTNDSLGHILLCFQVTNNTPDPTHGQYAVEVLHNGFWFNALPQPKGADDLIYLAARSATYFSVAAPTGRAEQGLVTQSDPPGEKWRTYFSYTAPRYPRNVFGAIMERLSKNVAVGRYAFSPEMSFEPANQNPQPTTR